MPQTVELPDKRTAEFPDDWSPALIQQTIWASFPQWAPPRRPGKPSLEPVIPTPAIHVAGQTFTGPDHVGAYANAKAGGQPDTSGAQEGFVDQHGQFMSREQAAAATGLPTGIEPGKLHSSDLQAHPGELPLSPEEAFRYERPPKGTFGQELAATASEAASLAFTPYVSIPKPGPAAPGASTAEKVARGVTRAVLGTVESVESPLGLALSAAGGASAVAARTIGVGFGAQASAQAVPRMRSAAAAGDIEGVAEQTANLVVGITAATPAALAIGRRLAPHTTATLEAGVAVLPTPPTLPSALPGTRPPIQRGAETLPRAQQVVGSDPLAGEYRVVEGMTRQQIEAAEAAANNAIRQAWPRMTPAEREAALRGKGLPQRFGGRATNQPPGEPTPPTTPEVPSARQVSPPTEVHGHVRPQPIPSPGQVPAQIGGQGVQPPPEGGLREPTPPAPPPSEPIEVVPPEQLPRALRASAEMIAEGLRPSPEAQAAIDRLRTENPALWRGYINYVQSLIGEGQVVLPPGYEPSPVGLATPPPPFKKFEGVPPLTQPTGPVTEPEPGLATGVPKALLPPTTTPPQAAWEVPQHVYRGLPEATTIPPDSVFGVDFTLETPESLGRFGDDQLRMAAKALGVEGVENLPREPLAASLQRQANLNAALEGATRQSLSRMDVAGLEQLMADAGLARPSTTAKSPRVSALLNYKARLQAEAPRRLADAKHELAVSEALMAGEDVPARVLRDYPHLRRRPPTAPPTELPPSAEPPTEPPMQADRGPEPGDPPAVAEQRATIANNAAGPHGLPAGVPTGPQGFAAEIMEATRRLGALARSKLTMRPGVLGQYAQTLEGDKIYVRDVRNQRTMSHEAGHALDSILFTGKGALRHSMESLQTRLTGTGVTTGKRLLFNQLAKVSELMRGPMGTSEYRRRASELIADWFSLFVHDPAHARAMAPDWSRGFEKALSGHAEAFDTVNQLLGGSVSPVAPELPPGQSGVTAKAVQLPGKLPPRQVLPPVEHDRLAASAAEGIVKNAVRDLEAALQRVRVWSDHARALVPNASERADVGAFVEGIGNLERQGDDIGAVRARMTPAMQALAKDYRYRQELERQKINEYLKPTEDGEYLRFLDDYMGHFYTDAPGRLSAAWNRFLKESPHAKQRKLPTLKEAVDLGLHPVTQDPVTTYELTSRINWRVATNRKAVAALRNITLLDGSPAVLPRSKAPAGWPTTDNPLIQRVYAHRAGEATHLWRGGAAIHPDVWRAAQQLLETPTTSKWGARYDKLNAITRGFAFSLSGFHDLSLRFASLGAAFRLSNPLRGLARVMERNPVTGEREFIRSTRVAGKQLLMAEDAVADAAQHGLRFAWTDSEAYQHAARDTVDRLAARMRDLPVLGRTARLGRDLHQLRQRGLWRNTHDAYKIVAYHDLVSKALDQAPPGTDPSIVKERVAGLLNDAFGGQEWQTMFWLEPKVRRIYSRFMLAPDWTISTVRSVPLASDIATATRTGLERLRTGQTPLPGLYEGVGNLHRLRFWGAELAAIAMSAIAAQYVIYRAFGKPDQGDHPWVWENEFANRHTVDVTPIMRLLPGHNLNDATRHYVNLGKRAAEVLRWIIHPTENVESKMARPMAELFKQLTGTEGRFKAEWERDHTTFAEELAMRGKSVVKEFLPFSFTGNQFALSVPMRKGMTKYKAQEAFESVYEVAADPSRIRRFIKTTVRLQPPAEGDLISMVHQISDAAYRNGVNADPVRERALSVVRGKHIALLHRAYDQNDQAGIKRELEIIARLEDKPGTTAERIRESFKRKQRLELGRPPTFVPEPATP